MCHTSNFYIYVDVAEEEKIARVTIAHNLCTNRELRQLYAEATHGLCVDTELIRAMPTARFDAKQCLVCMEERANCVYRPCRCQCICLQCMQHWLLECNDRATRCVRCQKTIDSFCTVGAVRCRVRVHK